MKRLLTKLVLLCAPFVLFFAVYQVQYERRHANALAAKRVLFEPQMRNVEVLVLGPSYTEKGVIPGVLGRSAFNLAMPAQSIYYDRALLDKYLDQMPALKTVLLPVSYVTLESQLDTGPIPARCYFYTYEFGLPHRQWKMTWNARNYFAYYLDDQARIDLLLGKGKDFMDDYDPKGGCVARLSELSTSENRTRLENSATAMMKLEKKSMKVEYLRENELILRDIIANLQQRGITAILFWPPAHESYRRLFDLEVYCDEKEMLARLHSETGVGVYDYTDDSRFADCDFDDPTHLNFSAAERYSRILREDLLEVESHARVFERRNWESRIFGARSR